MILTGKSAAPGAVVGSIYIYNEKYFIPAETFIEEGERVAHHERYLTIKEKAIEELEEIRQNMHKVDPAKASIFMAHKEIVDDITINEEIPAKILNDGWAGDRAIYHVYETFLSILRQAKDPLISERSADFDDVRALLLQLWHGQKNEGLSKLKEPVIVAAYDLKPSDTAKMDKEKVLAIITETGGETSHTAIISKSFGIPAVMGIEGLLTFIRQGQKAAVFAADGKVILDPEDDIALNLKINEFRRDREDAETFRGREGRTSCGVKIDIGLNISGSLEKDEELKASMYTDSVGLFRTEFLFMGRDTLPDEEEQFASYRKALEWYQNKTVIIRTLDIGADKQSPCIDIKHEDNPFLGNRGIRFCFNNPAIFKTQIRAALRASAYGDLWLMFPMVGSLEYFRMAKEFIAEIKYDLKKENIKYSDVKTGIMIEVPSIALISDLAAKEVDFASIGTNDLCQYLCAADRMNSAVDSYYQSYHPAMFRLIKEIASSFEKEGKPLSVCGELGSDPLAVPVLVGLGIRKLSMGAASVAAVKRTLASITVKKAEQIAKKTLKLHTAPEIEKFLSGK